MELVDGYFNEISKTMQVLPVREINKMVDLLHEARLNNQQVFVMGNGGSAATASHFVCDLIKNTRVECCPDFRVIGLADNMATFSAYGNDEGYQNVFARQLASLARAGDVVIGISTSGNSPNVLEAMKVATDRDLVKIGLTGNDGGILGTMVDLNVHIPNWRPDQTEDVHLIVLHSVTAILREMAKPTLMEQIEKAALPVSSTITLSSKGFHRTPEADIAPHQAMDRMALLLDEMEKEVKPLSECPDLLGALLLHITQSLQAASGSFVLIDDQNCITSAALLYNGRVSNANPDHMEEFINRGLAGWAVKNRQPALLPNTRKDRRWMEPMQTGSLKGARSVLCVPLIVEERVMGVITLSRSESDPFSGKEMLMLTGIIATITSRLLAKMG